MTKTKEMGINHRTMKQKLAEYRHQPLSLLLLALTLLAAVITVGVLLCLIVYILYKGIPNMHLSLFAWKYTTENSSMMPAIINTLLMTVVTLMIAVPIGVFSAIYLVEYAKRGNKLVKVIRMTTETLQGIPSIVFGLFGFLMFVVACNFGFSLLGGAITLALMVLPLIMRTTEEALLSVPDSFREGSFGLGAGRLRTPSSARLTIRSLRSISVSKMQMSSRCLLCKKNCTKPFKTNPKHGSIAPAWKFPTGMK